MKHCSVLNMEGDENYRYSIPMFATIAFRGSENNIGNI